MKNSRAELELQSLDYRIETQKETVHQIARHVLSSIEDALKNMDAGRVYGSGAVQGNGPDLDAQLLALKVMMDQRIILAHILKDETAVA